MLFLSLLAASVQAAPANPGATLIDRTRIDRKVPRPDPRAARKPVARAAIIADAPDVTITGIRFAGTQAPAKVAAAAQPFLGKKAARKTLGELAAALAAGYGESDIALYTVAIPAQDFSNGVVEVRLIEGRIAGVDFGAPAGPQLRGQLTPLTQEMPLSRATFERQLTLARAIPGLTLATDLTDPQATGALRLKVTPKQKRHRLTAGYSTRGVDLLGAGQLDLRAEGYGAFVDGDQLSAALSASPDLERYRLATAGYAAPVGTSGLTAALNGAYLATRPRGRPGKGTAKQLAASLSYPLIRSFTRAADVSLSLDGIDSDDATIGSVVSRERSRAARAAAGYVVASERRSLSLSGSLSRGLAIFAARSPDAERGFVKVTLSAAASQAIGGRLTARVSGSAQYSRDRLPAAERFAIGGEAIGRAFDEALLSGDRGGGALAEVAWRPIGKGKFASSELYGFGDVGTVRVLARTALPAATYSLASAGVGGRARYAEKGELSLEAARVVDRPFAGYREDWRVTAGWRLTL